MTQSYAPVTVSSAIKIEKIVSDNKKIMEKVISSGCILSEMMLKST